MAFYQWTAVILCVFVATLVASDDDDNEVSVSRGNNEFGLQWYQIRAGSPGNVMVSPFSAVVGLAMLLVGANGNTFSQLAQGLHLPEDKDTIASGMQSLLNSIRKAGEGNNTLTVANRIDVDSSFDIKEDYQGTLRKYFSSQIVTDNFTGDPEHSRIEINQWVEDQTHGRITDLLPQGVVTPDTRTILTNAIYFRGLWAKQFKSKDTRSEVFYKSCNDAIDVDMMHATGTYKYAASSEYQAIQLDYEGEELHMLIILPTGCDDGQGQRLQQVMNNLDLTDLQSSMRSRQVVLTIPKFKIETTIEMKSDLQALGMGAIFSDSADFSGISAEAIKVSAVIQKTFIEVSENGTEAAAATAVVVNRRTPSVPQPPTEFIVDHPFIFSITEKRSQAVLFIGDFKGTQQNRKIK